MNMSLSQSLVLDDSDRRELLRIARLSLKEWFRSGRLPPGAPHRQTLLQRMGVFVTLYVKEELRGCVGQVESETPLYRTVSELTVSAATRDQRFTPLQRDEIPDAILTISLLSPPERITSPEEIVIGRHGLIVSQGSARGLLLPQVAAEHGWDAVAFLGHTAVKAGLPAEAWRDPEATIERFTADVFSESSLQ